MDRAVYNRTAVSNSLSQPIMKEDGSPDVASQGSQYFVLAMHHNEFSRSGVIGNSLTATPEEKKAHERLADRLIAAITEFHPLTAEIKPRRFEDRV